MHVAYFSGEALSGEALWTYLNIPFIYKQPGFATEKIDPIKVVTSVILKAARATS